MQHKKVEPSLNRNPEVSTITLTPTQERRQSRRARISLCMRVRSADFGDGQLEQVVQTTNASRQGFYFNTTLQCYHAGMRLRIIVPYHEHVGATASEEMAEVIRVDQKSGRYGIAVARAASLEARRAVPEIQALSVPIEVAPERPVAFSERRVQQRAPFIATVAMTDMETGTVTRARTSDLSMCGCYIDTLNPLPLGAVVQLSIQKANEELKVQASVCTALQSSGMGVAFEALSAGQREIIKNWLLQCGASSV